MSLLRSLALAGIASLALAPLRGDDAPPPVVKPRVADSVGRITLVDEQPAQVAALLAKITGRMLLRTGDLPPSKINFQSGRDLSRAEAEMALESLLALNGVAVFPEGESFLKVVPAYKGKEPSGEAPQLYLESVAGLPPSDRFVARLFTFRNVPYSTVDAAMQLVVNKSRGGNAVAMPGANAVLVTDSLSNMQRIEAIIGTIDAATKVIFVPLKFTRAGDVVKQLKALQAGGLKTAFAGDVSFDSGGSDNRVIVVTNPANEARIREIIKGIDSDNSTVTRSEVIRLQHGEAAAAVALIQNVVTGTSGSVGQKNQSTFTAQGSQAGASGGNAQGAQGQPQGQRLNQAQGQQQQQAPRPGQQVAANDTDGAVFSGSFTANADLRSNSVVLFGTERDIKQAKSLIDSVDRKLPEVLIEVMVLEVTLGTGYANGLDQLGLGIYSGTQGINGGRKNGDYNVRGNTPTLPGSSFAPLSIGASIKDFSLEAVINKVRNDTSVKFLSSPTVRTTHNGKAVVVVSTQQPIVNGSTATPTNNGVTTTSSVDYKDIGLELDIIPRIGANGTVEMDIQQSVKSIIGVTTINGDQQPIISNRAANSYLTAEDGEVVVLAGLQSVNETKTKGKLFLLGYIPWIGDWLFSPETTDTKKSELMIFIKPHVITEADRNLAGDTPGLRSGSLTRDESQFRNKNGVFGAIKEETTYFERDAVEAKKNRDAQIREHDKRERELGGLDAAGKPVEGKRDEAGSKK